MAKGYTSLGFAIANQLPVVYSTFGDVLLSDAARPETTTNSESRPRLRRILSVTASQPEASLFALLAEGDAIKDLGDGVYEVDSLYRLTLVGVPNAELRKQSSRTLLIAPATWGESPVEAPAWTLETTALESGKPAYHAMWNASLEWLP